MKFVYMSARQSPIYAQNEMCVEVSTIIHRNSDAVYNFLRELPNLRLVMYHIKSIRVLSETNSEWIIKIPGGIGDIKWEAEIIKEQPGKYLEWITLPGATIEHKGHLSINSYKKDKTRVDISVSYKTLMNIGGSKIQAMLNKVVEEILSNEMQALKSYLESTAIIQEEHEIAKQNQIDKPASYH